MYFYRALGMAKEQQNKYIIGSALNEIAEVLQESETKIDLEQALEAATEACQIGRDLRIPTIELFSFVKLSKAYLKLGHLKEALDSSKTAIKFIDTHEETEKFTEEVFFNHYTVLKSLKRNDEALDYLDKAYKIIKQYENQIEDAAFKKSFIENVRLNRDIIDEKEKNNVS
jgi:tetratricopeptide (TPR) repeat protein